MRKSLTKMEEVLNQPSRVKYVEEMGRAVSDLLVRKDPWAKDGCGRDSCLPCRTDKGKCMHQGALYAINCVKCKAEGVTSTYY